MKKLTIFVGLEIIRPRRRMIGMGRLLAAEGAWSPLVLAEFGCSPSCAYRFHRFISK